MQIQLNIVSPGVELPGLSGGIAQLKELKTMLAELREQKTIEIKVGVSADKLKQQGAAIVQEMTTVQKSLVAQLESLGGTCASCSGSRGRPAR